MVHRVFNPHKGLKEEATTQFYNRRDEAIRDDLMYVTLFNSRRRRRRRCSRSSSLYDTGRLLHLDLVWFSSVWFFRRHLKREHLWTILRFLFPFLLLFLHFLCTICSCSGQ